MIIKIASKVTVHNVPWRDQLTEIDLQANGEWIDEWLETPVAFRDASIEDGTDIPQGISRVKIGGTGFRRHGQALTHKQAAATPQTDWDEEFAAAKAHAASVLKQLG